MEFSRPITFEMPLSDDLMLLASFGLEEKGGQGYVSFDARRSGDVIIGPTCYSHWLRDNQVNWDLAMLVDGIAREEISGRTAKGVVWLLFYRLVTRGNNAEALKWLVSLNNEFLNELVGVGVVSDA